MEFLLKQISQLAIKLGDVTFTDEQIKSDWLGNAPASATEIKLAEDRLGVELPQDYKDFLLVTNGFSAPNDIEPTFEHVSNIDFLKNIDSDLINIWSEVELVEIGKELAKSIVIAGINEEQYFLLIPPDSAGEKWKYWKFASWHPGEHPYRNLESYFRSVSHFIRDMVSKG
ncbi:SMI1/KNR4 family protein [Mucilaginibacter sabulilitoris]|uniref:SMI1/KNR4 family protein n=1 Tax=Mucilaginibacter sabulilitoris TaxID=1173583 RepID=A0ABZ0TQJ1_9SPHI|nr:SMI1/KNR4 family protein [Mucilaginibacter sabulilitoris]WPU93415.1 SMI1/KNR4 family protein [Mucilaginibacter sabulilitoris]